ncbi:MAG TPA: hypothetical protein VIU46_02520, partial [Gallionellaceae bacterium]
SGRSHGKAAGHYLRARIPACKQGMGDAAGGASDTYMNLTVHSGNCPHHFLYFHVPTGTLGTHSGKQQ